MLADEDFTMTMASDASFEQTRTLPEALQSTTTESAGHRYTYQGSMGTAAETQSDALHTPGPAGKGERSRWMDVDDLGDLTEEERNQVEALLEEREQVRGINRVLEGLVDEMNGLLLKVDVRVSRASGAN